MHGQNMDHWFGDWFKYNTCDLNTIAYHHQLTQYQVLYNWQKNNHEFHTSLDFHKFFWPTKILHLQFENLSTTNVFSPIDFFNMENSHYVMTNFQHGIVFAYHDYHNFQNKPILSKAHQVMFVTLIYNTCNC